MNSQPRKSPVIENKKARRNYEILETVEAGIVLIGSEVKSIRLGGCEIADAYVTPTEDEMLLLNLRIEPYRNAGAFGHEETRTRKLLLHKNEILKMKQKIREKGLSAIPLKIYFNDKGRVKVLIGLGRGKKLADKRETEKKAEAKREIDRAMKESSKR
jgi:SsrA-binding protein